MGVCESEQKRTMHGRNSSCKSLPMGTQSTNSGHTTRSSSKVTENKMKFPTINEDEMKLCVEAQNFIEESNEMPTSKYEIIKQLGARAFGSVFYSKNRINQNEVALKKILKNNMNKIDNLDISNEIEILKKLTHPNIMKIYEFYNTKTAYYIVEEYCSQGELFGHIKQDFSEDQIAFILYQILSALCYLHQQNITHRDLKLENILVSDIEEDPDTKEKYYWIKLIDFGAAKIISRRNEKTVVGTSYYIAPEVLKGNYNYKCDLWSVGVILFMMTTNKAPFGGVNNQEIEENILKGEYSKEYPKYIKRSNELKDLISKLLDYNPTTRISAEKALQHPFFTKHDPKRIIKINFINTKTEHSLVNNLLNYKLQSKLQQVALAYICHNIKYQIEIKNALKLFYLFNTNNNGMLSKEELYQSLTRFISETESINIIDSLFTSLNMDNYNYINYEEFCSGCLYKEIISKEENLQSAFNFFEATDDKAISAHTLKNKFSKGKKSVNVEKVCKRMIKEAVRNDADNLNYNDFKHLMMSSIGDTMFIL